MTNIAYELTSPFNTLVARSIFAVVNLPYSPLSLLGEAQITPSCALSKLQEKGVVLMPMEASSLIGSLGGIGASVERSLRRLRRDALDEQIAPAKVRQLVQNDETQLARREPVEVLAQAFERFTLSTCRTTAVARACGGTRAVSPCDLRAAASGRRGGRVVAGGR